MTASITEPTLYGRDARAIDVLQEEKISGRELGSTKRRN